jgi:RimJ/RimL family protein N-acetyltransferase
MLNGKRVTLRRVTDEDWKQIEAWADDRDALCGANLRFQPELLSRLEEGYQKTGLFSRDKACLVIETVEGKRPIGIITYQLLAFPDQDLPVPEIGFSVADAAARGKGYAKEAVGLLVRHLYESFPGDRVMAVTECENVPSQRVLEALGFRREGVLRRAMFRAGRWNDAFLYGLLREEFKEPY